MQIHSVLVQTRARLSETPKVRYCGRMARLDEIVEGIVTVLQLASEPEPLPIDLRGESPADVTFLVRAIVDACERRGVPLSLVRLDQQLGAHIVRAEGDSYQGIYFQLEQNLATALELYRFPQGVRTRQS